jgi:hypothetical protein
MGTGIGIKVFFDLGSVGIPPFAFPTALLFRTDMPFQSEVLGLIMFMKIG